MPTTFLESAVDFDGDGRRDVVGTIPDALASTANYLRRAGWRPGEPWGWEVRLPAGGRVLLPIAFARIRKDEVVVDALLASQFGNVPALARNDQITMLEEEKVSAYYGAGTLYATPDRQEPLA
jgi:membrane-bound lytic murein transglycosylase B